VSSNVPLAPPLMHGLVWRARITLATVTGGIAVSSGADAGAAVRLPATGAMAAIEQQQDVGVFWVEAR
jgi:hypothetical protein